MSLFLSLNPVFQGLFATLFTYLMTAAGAALVFFFHDVSFKFLNIMIGFAAGIMIASSFWSLLSPALKLSHELGTNSLLVVSSGFLCGGIFIITADVLLSRASFISEKDHKLRRNILLFSAVTLHNIPEGLAVGIAFGCVAVGVEGFSITAAIMLALGIGIQNFPEGVCVAMPLRRDGASRKRSFIIGQASGLVEPLAGLFGAVCSLAARPILPFALAFSAGAMIVVVCSELIPESYQYGKTVTTLGIISGFVTMMVLDVAFG